ncbi:MAG TPA: enoyl-CoA hydratase/isomerase family protein [Acidimicrobiales bacterium]|nr:enoyl-CoA hydratase/isomerase family protein [Acidimicrobiales bacterium]
MTSQDSYETLQFNVVESVATVTFARPGSLNALNPRMADELFEVAVRCDLDPDVRAVVVTGSGKAFMSGGDLGAFAEAGDGRDALIMHMASRLHGAISHFNRMDAPVIAAVNGVAAGAGMSLALSLDLAVAARSARFVMAYTRAGLAPDGGSSYFLPRLVGLRRAQELVLTNRELSADEAEFWGIVNEVVDDEHLGERVDRLARHLASGPTRTLGVAKRLMREGVDETLESQMEKEGREIAASSVRPDGVEGIEAFLAKRPPKFAGQ